MHNKKYDFMIQCAKVQRSPDTGSNIHWTRLGSDSEKIQEAEFGHYASCTADESGRPMVATGLRVEKQKDKRHHQLICKPITLSNHIIAGLERLAHLDVHRQHALQGAHSLSPASFHQVRCVLPSAHAKKDKSKTRGLPGLDALTCHEQMARRCYPVTGQP